MGFTWLEPLNWIRARRHLTAYLVDTTNLKRRRWVELQRRSEPDPDFVLRRELPAEFSFLVLGDTGEGDASQMVVVDKFLSEGAGTAFTVVAGDVVYPSGRSADYREKFYVPYRNYPADVYAVPGNHDWYDELTGFMVHFCDTVVRFRSPHRRTIDPEKLRRLRNIRRNACFQPNMYFCIDAPTLRIVCIDAGIRGRIDDEQARWLRRVSADPRPKVLISGFPMYVDGRRTSRLRDVRSIVEGSNYVLVVAGDTHNFQAYRVPVNRPDGGTVWHLVNGGGGAYATPTSRIPPLDRMDLGFRPGPEDVACYPPRASSSAPGWRRRLPGWLVDDDAAPYFRSFVKVDVRTSELRVRAFGVEDFGPAAVEAPPVWEAVIPLAHLTALR